MKETKNTKEREEVRFTAVVSLYRDLARASARGRVAEARAIRRRINRVVYATAGSRYATVIAGGCGIATGNGSGTAIAGDYGTPSRHE